MNTTTNEPIAGLGRRLFAMVYDVLLLLALLFCVAGAYFTVLTVIEGNTAAVASIGAASTGDVVHELEVVEPGWLFYPLMLFVYCGFYCYFWFHSGQTLGMRAWKIKLVAVDAPHPSLSQLGLRMLTAVLSIGFLGLGYLTLLINRDAGTWHDRLSKTRIVTLASKAS